VGVEPISMVCFLGNKADNCRGSTGFEELQPWTSLDYVVSDAGVGHQAGIAQMQHHRRETEQVPLRLYWNCCVFRGGKRKDLCPYEHLGLKLPSFNFWTLLQGETNTALANAKAAVKAKAKAA